MTSQQRRKIQKLRRQVDELDRRIARDVRLRIRASMAILQLKKTDRLKAIDPQRERQILRGYERWLLPTAGSRPEVRRFIRSLLSLNPAYRRQRKGKTPNLL